MTSKDFYDKHLNFSLRTISEYYISPGIKCKFDILKKIIGKRSIFKNALDIGCSGNSFLFFLENINHKSYLDIAETPLKQYLNKNILKESEQIFHPINADLCNLPYRNKKFDLIIILDVLEHIKKDYIAIEEISRILKKKGLIIATIPHKMKYFSNQDKLIGHYRRYEIRQLKELFYQYNLKIINTFGIYGQLFKITEIQSYNPQKVEDQIKSLRNRYQQKLWFRKIWDFIVKILSYFMKMEAKYQSINKLMNIGCVIQKIK